MTIEQLLDVLLQHRCRAWIAQGRILAVDSWIGPGRIWVDEIIMLPSDLGAIRRWLGY